MPELKQIPLHEIDEPTLPMRAKMDDGKLVTLMNSIVNNGQHTPAFVKMVDGRYQIVSGHRRFVALQRLGRERMSCLVFGPDENCDENIKVSENEDREEVNAAEQALYYAQLLDQRGLDEAGLCALVKRAPDYIADRLRLLRQDEMVFQAVLNEEINFSVARELNKVPDQVIRRSHLDQAIRSGTSARVVAQWNSQWRASLAPAPASPPPSTDAPAPEAPPPYKHCCSLCGGDKDPYNLISIEIHRWEWDRIVQLLREIDKNGGTLQ